MFQTRRIPVDRLRTHHEIVIASFRYPVNSVRTLASGEFLVSVAVTANTEHCELLPAGAKVRVVMPERRVYATYADRDRGAEGAGSYSYRREINGWPYQFTFVVMPSGERRYFVSRYNGYCDDGTSEGRMSAMKFGCAWTQVHAITVKPEPVCPRGWDRVEGGTEA